MKLFKLLLTLAVSSLSFFTEANEKQILFGAQSTPDGIIYEIGFCARAKNEKGSGPGHAFVMYRKYDSENQLLEFYTAGLTPGDKRVPYTTHGLIESEKYSDPSQICLIAKTNETNYINSMNFAKSHGKYSFGGVTVTLNNTYSLLTNDCVTFMGAVAEHFGLNTPSRTLNMTPMSFVDALIKMH